MFQLDEEEAEILRSQDVTSSHGGRRYLPYVFTQKGVAMLSSVLNSPLAVAVNIEIMHTFVGLRDLARSHEELGWRLDQLEAKYDEQFAVVFEAIRELMVPLEKERREIGLRVREKRKSYASPAR